MGGLSGSILVAQRQANQDWKQVLLNDDLAAEDLRTITQMWGQN